MKNSAKIQFEQYSVYTFDQAQIRRGDVTDFLMTYDPYRMPNNSVKQVFGGLVFRFEGISAGEAPAHPQLRLLLRRLHAIWPWSGFFLNLETPLGPDCGVNRSPLLAIGICLTEMEPSLWRQTEPTHVAFGTPVRRFYDHCHKAIDRLGKRTALPAQALQARHEAVCLQFNDILK